MKQFRTHNILVTGILLLVSVCAFPFDHYLRLSADFSYARDKSGVRGDATGNYLPDENIGLREAQTIIGSGQPEAGVSGNGFAPGLGVGYRMMHSHFLLDVGLVVEYRQTYAHPGDLTNVYQRGVDEEGLTYMGHHQWTARRCALRHVGINIPVMLGGEWGAVYFLAGVKASVDVWGTSTENGLYSLEGIYDRYMDPFNGMDNHGFVTDEPYRCDPVAQPAAFNLRACAEVGYCVYGANQGSYRRKETIKLYVSAFGEYSVLGNEGAYLPLLVGARVTMLMPLPKKRVCTCSRF